MPKTLNFILLTLAVLLDMVMPTAAPPGVIQAQSDELPACRMGTQWVWFRAQVLRLTDFTNDERCVWDYDTPPTLWHSGACGVPWHFNEFMVWAHALAKNCSNSFCFVGRGGQSDWPLLRQHETVYLCDLGNLWRGEILDVINNAGAQGIDARSEFFCPTGWCGTLTTCAYARPGFTVVRIAYRRVPLAVATR